MLKNGKVYGRAAGHGRSHSHDQGDSHHSRQSRSRSVQRKSSSVTGGANSGRDHEIPERRDARSGYVHRESTLRDTYGHHVLPSSEPKHRREERAGSQLDRIYRMQNETERRSHSTSRNREQRGRYLQSSEPRTLEDVTSDWRIRTSRSSSPMEDRRRKPHNGSRWDAHRQPHRARLDDKRRDDMYGHSTKGHKHNVQYA